MLRFLTIAALLTFAPGLPAAPVPKELKRENDAEKMQGLWKETTGTRWFFEDKKLFAGGQNLTDRKGHAYELALRPDAAPREFDLSGNAGAAIQFAGIYKFEGEELHICYHSGPQRPKDFTPGAGKFIHILKREEAKK